jgi:hypothetical protein
MGGRRCGLLALLGLRGLRFRAHRCRSLRSFGLLSRNARPFGGLRLFRFRDRRYPLVCGRRTAVSTAARRRFRCIEAIKPLQLKRHVLVDGAGVGHLFGDAQFRQPFQDLPGLHFQLPGQLVNANLVHR